MKKYITIMLITLAVAGSSCKKTYLDELATNPNTPAITTPDLALAGALKSTAANFNGTGFTMYAAWMGYLSWSTGYQPNVQLLSYQFTSSTYDVWTNWYLNISNYTAMANSTTNPYYQAIAKIMISYDYESLVDNYNNVPYTQALQGSTNLTPTYDTGSSIYDNLLTQLDAAIALIQGAPTGTITPTTSDIMYGGNMTNWARFANTLRLRIIMRQYGPTGAINPNVSSKAGMFATELAKLFPSGTPATPLGFISTTAQEGKVNPGYANLDANGGEQQPLDLAYGYNQSGAAIGNNPTYQANTYAVNFYQSNSDPRLTQIYATSTGGAVIATPLGQTTPPAGTPSKLSAFLLNPTKAAFLFTAAESLFLQAEAAKDGLITGTALTLYDAGITASFTDLGLTAAQATTYYSQAAIASPTEQNIITQKWAALNPFAANEAFNEMRRTGIPNVPVSILPGNTQTTQPTRIFYPIVEYNVNAANVAAQGTISETSSKIFWAQ